MRIVLTGATGFIGQALVRVLRRRQWQVDALVRDPYGAPARWLSSQGCNLVAGDVTRPDGLASAMRGGDVVIHNAGVYELGGDARAAARMTEVNVKGTDYVLGSALEAGVARTIYVSSVAALGATGAANEPVQMKDESARHSGHYPTRYDRSKAESHQVALSWRAKGLPLVIAMPNVVLGVNDHSVFGYFLRLYLLHRMPPMAWGGDAVFSFVDVDALAEGLCLAAEKAPMDQDYLFCGEPVQLREMFRAWGAFPGGMVPRLWLPRWFMKPQLAVLEPLQRALGLPAFLGRDTVDASRGHLSYSSEKAKRDLGWEHPSFDDMMKSLVPREMALMAHREGWLNKLKHQAVLG